MRTFGLTGLVAAFVGTLMCSGPAAEQIEAGNWSATIGETGPGEIVYRGEVIARRGNLGAYLPHWEGGRFFMTGAEVVTTDTTATWHKADAGNQEATLRLELTPDKCVFSLDTTITGAGPSEFSIQLEPEAVRTSESHCFTWTNGPPKVLPLDTVFEKTRGIDEMRFVRSDRTVIVRCDGFELQDRRGIGSGLFFVKVIGSSGDEVRSVQSSIEIAVEEADATQVSGRRELAVQQPVEYLPVSVENPGFEDEEPLAGWTENRFVAIDTETTHGGDAAPRLTLTGDEEDPNPYIVQQVPVEEKRLYRAAAWVKTEDVEPAPVRGMSPTGATIIIEFADKNGDWFASGDYAQGVYDSHDWQRVRTDPARAPEGAGYAVIFLSLRARGTTWFDDVSVDEVRRHVILLDPLPGETVDDNTPTFNWYFEPRSPTTLELCQDGGFPEDDTVTVPDVRELPLATRKPIRPGRWYWRVKAPEYDYASAAWTFQQTASLDRDCTEPIVEPEHAWTGDPNKPLRVPVSDNVGVDLRKTTTSPPMKLVSDARLAVTGSTPVPLQYVPERGWDKGLNTVILKVCDEAHNCTEHTLWVTHTDPVSKIQWQEHGGVTIDGEKHFLFGMYGARIEDMPKIAAGGFDFVHNYRWDGAGTNEEAIEYLDAAQENGLQAFIGFSREQLMDGNEQFVAERVGALMDHPGLFAWYLYDEPDLQHQYVSPMWLERYYELIKDLDPFHPVIVTCARDDAVEEYRDALDVHWTQVYGNTRFVAARLPRHRASLRPGTPLAAILHCYDRGQTSLLRGGEQPDPGQFQPDAKTLRANAFMAIAKNSSCLVWWWWGQGNERYFTIADAPEAWEALKETIADIKALEPVLTADGEIHMATIEAAENVEIHVWEKKLDDRSVIIAVNRDEEACEVALRPETLPEDCEAGVLFEGRRVRAAGGELRDRFEPLDVHVYEWRAAE